MMMPAPLPRDLHDAMSADAWSRGMRILQGNRLAPTDEEHVAELLELMAPPLSACVLDIGCGFGEVARIMRRFRPDLRFVLLNDSSAQLAKAPVGEAYAHVCADMHRTGLPSGFFDGAMALYSLCHADLGVAMAESARVVKRGGFLFIYDYERKGGNNALMERHLHAHAHSVADMSRVAVATGWRPQFRHLATGNDALFRGLMGDDGMYDAIFGELEPVIWRMVRV